MAALAILLIVGPGLGGVRSQLSHASPVWIGTAVVLEVCSCLAYVVLFRAVFCPRMSWRLSYQIGMAEQAANSLLPVSGAGGLALGAWALRRGGMSAEYIGRRTVAFFFLTSLANVGAVIVFASLYALGVLGHDPTRRSHTRSGQLRQRLRLWCWYCRRSSPAAHLRPSPPAGSRPPDVSLVTRWGSGSATR